MSTTTEPPSVPGVTRLIEEAYDKTENARIRLEVLGEEDKAALSGAAEMLAYKALLLCMESVTDVGTRRARARALCDRALLGAHCLELPAE